MRVKKDNTSESSSYRLNVFLSNMVNSFDGLPLKCWDREDAGLISLCGLGSNSYCAGREEFDIPARRGPLEPGRVPGQTVGEANEVLVAHRASCGFRR